MKSFIFACLTVACVVAYADDPMNLVKNSGFEELTEGGFARDWLGGEFGKPGKNVTIDKTVAHSGECSVKVGINPNSFVTCAAASIPVKPETKYFLSWWCKTDGLKRARAYVFFQTNKGQRVFPGMNQYVTQDWTRHFAEYMTTAEETSLHPVLTTHDNSGPECFAWFDDVAVYEGAFPEGPAAGWRAYLRELSGVSETALVLAKTPDLTVWVDDLAARIYREDGLPEYAEPARQVEVAAARGEEEFFQLALIPANDLADVVLEPRDLVGPGTIPAKSIRWWPVGYVNIKVAHRAWTRLGMTPDPLLDPGPVAAPRKQNTPFCVGIRVPEDTKSGQYRGAVVLRAGETTLATVPVSLRVYDFSLPKDPTFRTIITFSSAAMSKWDKRPVNEIEKDICRVLHDHGIRGHGATTSVAAKLVDGKVVCDFTSFDARIQWVMDNLDFNAFFLGPMFGGGTGWAWEEYPRKWLGMEKLSDDFNKHFPEYMRQVARHLKEKGWFDKAYLYLWDEPQRDYFDKLVVLQKLALQGDPGFKVWETTSPNHEAFWGVVKAWSVPFGRQHFDEQTVEARRNAGDEIWVYNIPATLERPPQTHRLWFWQAARYGATGAQLWNVNFYRGIDPWEEITPKPYPVGRGKSGLYHYDAGQAIMLYPNPKGTGRPLPCLRLKLLKKGIDDFEYLSILQANIEKAARKRGAPNPELEARARVREIASMLVKDMGRYELDTAALESLRTKLAEQIEATAEAP